MIAQRVGSMALRRAAANQPGSLVAQTFARSILASNVAAVQHRPASTDQTAAPADPNALLAAQRLRRPVSPHLSVYDPKQTWFSASIWQRFTGGGFAGLLYLYAGAYLVAPLAGWHLESASLAAAFGTLPFVVKGGVKTALAWPFVYHLLNGVKHLVNDLAVGYKKPQIRAGAYGVWIASMVGALGLVAFF